MITRPLDLLSRLRPPPRNFDFIYLVNGGLIALFFTLFSSHFVLSPGLRVDNRDILLPKSEDPITHARATPVSISVNANGQVWGGDGLIALARLPDWMLAQAKRAPGSTLLVIMDTRAPMDVFTNISDAAKTAGFVDIQLAMQSVVPSAGVKP
ncbi:MAG: biopolymer transporter ExbD [Verrucomicrobia bacterium]|nr:biopolymer transporter ExbD [Verrucomicrobiota bacterium]